LAGRDFEFGNQVAGAEIGFTKMTAGDCGWRAESNGG
jgi:hypothetical protein